MRKQYHFRTSDRGLLAWDVDGLIERTARLKASAVPLGAIRELDEPYWYELGGDQATCRSIVQHMRLMQAADLAHPIILCPEGRVMDGMHRVCKALLQGHSTIRAYRLSVLPEPDYIGVDADDLPYDQP